MSISEIVTVTLGDISSGSMGILGSEGVTVKDFGDGLAGLVTDLLDTMYSHPVCIGLAAPQIGVASRVAVIHQRVLGQAEPVVLINPKVVELRGKRDAKREVCMSLPGWTGSVRRKSIAVIEYQDVSGKPCSLQLDGFSARVAQHEIDHLSGLMYVSHLRADESVFPVS